MTAHKPSPYARLIGGLAMGLMTLSGASALMAQAPSLTPGSTPIMDLETCLRQAIENNHRQPAAAFALQAAEAQHQQALAGYWPQVGMRIGFQRMDESPNFLFPASTFTVPAQLIPVGGGMFIPIPAQDMQIPAQDVKLMGRDTTSASLNATWLLWDGGWRRGLAQQARGGVDVAKADLRRTELEVRDSVTRMYYGAILARQLHQVGRDALARMEATLTLTETLYKEGSGKVKKTDYLSNKVMVETLRASVAQLERNELLARAALANTMGLGWQVSVEPEARDIPFQPYAVDLEKLVDSAYRFNVDWTKLEAGLSALEGAEGAARSGHAPKLALTVDLFRRWNDYDAGLATDRNKKGWTLGLGIEIPIFNGQLVRNQVREARARLEKAKEEQLLLKDGIGLMVKDTLLSLTATAKTLTATGEAMKAAEENRDLNTRAYQNELVGTEDVLKAQLFESLMTAQHLKSRYDHAALQSQMTLIVGNEVWRQLKSGP